MSRHQNAKTEQLKQKKSFPTIFYYSLAAEKIPKKADHPVYPPSAAAPRRLLLWAAVAIIMIFLAGLWSANLKEKINSLTLSSVKQELFRGDKAADFFQMPLNKNEKKVEAKDQLSIILERALTAASASNLLQDKKISELKKKIENKK